MKTLTYRELKDRLNELVNVQLDMSVTIAFGTDENAEFFGVTDTCLSTEELLNDAADGVLDPGTPVLLIAEDDRKVFHLEDIIETDIDDIGA